jgi:hypothetical protein
MAAVSQALAAYSGKTPPPIPQSLGLLDKMNENSPVPGAGEGMSPKGTGIRYFTPGAPDAKA